MVSQVRGATVGDVFVIALENHDFTQPASDTSPKPIAGNVAAPFINSLITPGNADAANVSYATNYTNSGTAVHPSEPNYIWAEAGTNYNVATNATIVGDNDPSAASKNIFSSTPHLTGLMNMTGVSWKNYQEDYQISGRGATSTASGTLAGGATNSYNGSTLYSYAAKHDPMAFFTDTSTQNLAPISQLSSDLTGNSIGRYNWITPNLYNDMHTALSTGFTYHGTHYIGDQAAIAQGDNFLSIVVPLIEASAAFQNNGAIVIWNDETGGGDTTAFTSTEIVISPLAKGNAYASGVALNHSSDIKTMQEIFGLGSSYLNNTIPGNEYSPAGGPGTYNTVGGSNDLSDLFKAGAFFPLVQASTWVSGHVGTWSTDVNWVGGVVPANAAGLSYAVTINGGMATLDINATINSLTLNSGTLNGTGNLTLSSGIVSATYNVTGVTSLAADTIAGTPVGTLTFANGSHNAGTFTGTGSILVGAGAALTSDGITLNQLTINGTLAIRPNGSAGGTSVVNTLSIAGSTGHWTGSVDLTNNKLVIETPDAATKATAIATLQNQIQSYGQGGSLGITATGLPGNEGIAVVDNAALGLPFTSFGGQVVDLRAILIAPELLGDSDLSGTVDLNDLNAVLNNLGQITAAWTSGNFDGAATVDLNDLNDVLNNLGSSFAGNSEVLAAIALAQGGRNSVPEPATLALVAGPIFFVAGRKNRRLLGP